MPCLLNCHAPCRYESFDVDSEAPFKVGKRIRITAANVVNVNVTSAGLATLVESVLSWRNQIELEQQARMSLEMVCVLSVVYNFSNGQSEVVILLKVMQVFDVIFSS
jgi:hypothetical protein